jgi:hypothetical protein
LVAKYMTSFGTIFASCGKAIDFFFDIFQDRQRRHFVPGGLLSAASRVPDRTPREVPFHRCS